jgi:hypothetical protein
MIIIFMVALNKKYNPIRSHPIKTMTHESSRELKTD